MTRKERCINCGKKEYKDLLCKEHYQVAQQSKYAARKKPGGKKGKYKSYTDDVDDKSYKCHIHF